MSPRLPSLTALRAFDAAARHLSFAAAAKELNVTPAALSFQIKQLEEDLGAPLFHRMTRAVALTAKGEALAPAAQEAFEILRSGWSAARRLGDDRRLTVTAGPGFTAKWLAPQLGRFARQHPDVELRVVSTLAMLDLRRDEIDLAVRFGGRGEANLFSEPLVDDHVLPVAAPALAETLGSPPDLREATLISDESVAFLRPPPDWRAWCTAAGWPNLELPAAAAFTQADHAVDAALDGAGVALTRYTMARDALRSGALIAPFAAVLKLPAGFRILCPLGEEERPAVSAFRAFLHAAAQGFDSLLADKTIVSL